jgi:hypothetical protein
MVITRLKKTSVYVQNLKKFLKQETRFKTSSDTFEGRRIFNVTVISMKYEAL